MPAALIDALGNQFLILIRRRNLLSPMPIFIAKPASRNDVYLCGCSAVFMGFKMLAGTEKASSLTKCDVVFRSEFKDISRTHRLLAIIAAAGLAEKSERTGFFEGFTRFCHILSDSD